MSMLLYVVSSWITIYYEEFEIEEIDKCEEKK